MPPPETLDVSGCSDSMGLYGGLSWERAGCVL